ncbi:MAG: nuclear transport factor 2 family protein [Acidobacteria bacterium]|nr:nuclear transport factor 2 family protein [Acidobacteriota bacterium]
MAEVAASYFDVYAERSDFDRFMSFYADDAYLKDVVYGNEVRGKENIRRFFDWNGGNFKAVGPGPALTIEAQIVSGEIVVTRGVFNRFEYGGKVLGPWEFVIWQQFNESGEIIRQEDWINYSPKEIHVGE